MCVTAYRSFTACSRSAVRQIRQADQSFRIAVVGSGPAGFYTAHRVMSQLPHAKIDMFESLPVPFGLVRFGVAPDHPEVKNCQDKFEEVASSPRFSFIGNVSIDVAGPHTDSCTVPLPVLLRHYDAILLAYGAAEDQTLGIPGESDLRGIYSARQFVGWYNGLPEYARLAPDLTKGDEAVIIGQGNVALDIARILLEDIDVLRRTDITENALAHLAASRVKRVHVVGRRGPMQAAFTIKEGSLAQPSEADKSWSLDFCLSPIEFLPSGSTPTDVALGNDGRGRALRADSAGMSCDVVSGIYCAGWAKRGPTGVIASTMLDAFETADSIVQDWLSGLQFLRSSSSNKVAAGWDGVRAEVGQAASKRVSWDDWHKIDNVERERGRAAGKEREKITSTKAMLEIVA
ncbi:NADPH:adrenodoxin oxidoreductase [Colletotrichum orbiculare MAFF 240422]|uniref:adrenodoxin-NADP(+) reductase n=1 Tax=Colletotrichum orbiculare (strain 104-T / ATCC 96160 / CBS 514.97 / LARS 414 / MAFF 240422) TaxID=1213857 RepID=A0A484FX91_COLOR|nr:NADPH:adrenodoxin oxidoreductase [Colletotrichum orbiculare MAFF 240422]